MLPKFGMDEEGIGSLGVEKWVCSQCSESSIESNVEKREVCDIGKLEGMLGKCVDLKFQKEAQEKAIRRVVNVF